MKNEINLSNLRLSNLELLQKECDVLFERHYPDYPMFERDNRLYKFTGVLIGIDDYYYVMYNIETEINSYVSCVADLEMAGFIECSKQ